MSIVLAIEPDRRQAAHLTAIARHLVGAELVLADTTEGALDAIGNRVPDLVLVPALLSPQDDAALAAALRVIAAAAHVRTLTIPVLASGTKGKPVAGMLAKWRRNRSASPEPDGCDPAVFAEQISTYLQEAAAAREQLDDDRVLVVQPVVTVERPSTIESEWAEPIAPDADRVQPWAAAAFVEDTIGLAAPPVEEADADIDPEDPSVDLSVELEGLSGDGRRDADSELFDGEQVGVYTLSADAGDVEIAAAAELVVDAAAAPYDDAALREFQDIAAWSGSAPASPIAGVASEPLFVEPPEPPRAHATSWVPMYLTPGRMWPTLEGMPAETPVARTEQPDWIELVASLRQDLERRRTDQAPAKVDPIAARPSDGVEAELPHVAKKEKPPVKKARPVQDEWGFFDPEQCGFSTLLAKLDEISEDVPGL